MQTLDAQIDIDAPPERVWAVVSDLNAYPLWNPFIVRASGELRAGARLRITIAAHGRRPVTFKPRVLEVVSGGKLLWLGRTFLPGLFDGRHALTVEPLEGDRSRFRTHEDVTGILLPFVGGIMRDSQLGFEDLCRALKERAEAPAAPGGAPTAER